MKCEGDGSEAAAEGGYFLLRSSVDMEVRQLQGRCEGVMEVTGGRRVGTSCCSLVEMEGEPLDRNSFTDCADSSKPRVFMYLKHLSHTYSEELWYSAGYGE